MKINTLKQLRLFLAGKQTGSYAMESDKPYLLKGFIYSIIEKWLIKNGHNGPDDLDADEFPLIYTGDVQNTKKGIIHIKEDITPLLSVINKDRTELKKEIMALLPGQTSQREIDPTLTPEEKHAELNVIKKLCYSLRPGEISCTISGNTFCILAKNENDQNTRANAFKLFDQVSHKSQIEFIPPEIMPGEFDKTAMLLYRQYMYSYNQIKGKSIKAELKRNKIIFYIGAINERPEVLDVFKQLIPTAIKQIESGEKISHETYLQINMEMSKMNSYFLDKIGD